MQARPRRQPIVEIATPRSIVRSGEGGLQSDAGGVEVDEVGLRQFDLDAGEAARKQRDIPVVLGETVDVVVERVQATSVVRQTALLRYKADTAADVLKSATVSDGSTTVTLSDKTKIVVQNHTNQNAGNFS